jgi:hypothetical protein
MGFKKSIRRGPGVICSLLLIGAVLLAGDREALAQASRQEEIARLQAEKAQQLRPPERSTGEKVLAQVEEIVASPSATVYPWVGSVYPGGFLGFGGGFRQTYADTGVFNALGAWSLKNYKLARADLKLPEFADRRIALVARGVWLDAPSVAFYGLGPDSNADARRTFEYQPATVGITGTMRLTDWLATGAAVDYLDVKTGRGTVGDLIAPGLGLDFSYLIGRASIAVDWRDSPGYSRRGGLYRVEWTPHVDRDDGGFGFRQTEAEVVQLLPLFRASSVLAFRGLVTTTDTRESETVPTFMLPALGGGSTLRGYPSWRFRDRHRLLFSGEYRWTPAQLIDMALFADAGKVAARRRDLDLDNLKTNYGIGIRFHGPTFTALRLDLARGREGWVINLGGGTAF